MTSAVHFRTVLRIPGQQPSAAAFWSTEWTFVFQGVQRQDQMELNLLDHPRAELANTRFLYAAQIEVSVVVALSCREVLV